MKALTGCWATQYIGRPYDDTDGLGKCLGRARDIYREVFDTELIGAVGIARLLRDGKDLPLRVVKIPKDGTLVTMHNKANPARVHVGVYCAAAALVVHASDERMEVVATPIAYLEMLYDTVVLREFVR